MLKNLSGHSIVGHKARQDVGQGGEFMEMRGEETEASHVTRKMLRNGPGQPKSVIRRSAPTQLVHYDQRVASSQLRSMHKNHRLKSLL